MATKFTETRHLLPTIQVICLPCDTADMEKFGNELVYALRHTLSGHNIHIRTKIPQNLSDHEYGFYIRMGRIARETQTPEGIKYEYDNVLDYFIEKAETQDSGLVHVTLKQF